MKRIALVICIILSTSLFAQKDLYDIVGNKIEINSEKTSVIVLFSTSSCHKCYEDLNDCFVDKDFFNKNDVDVYVVTNITKENNSDMQYKRDLYDSMKKYFPLCKNICFNTQRKRGKPIFCSVKINEFFLPNVFILKDKKLIKFYETEEAFIKSL